MICFLVFTSYVVLRLWVIESWDGLCRKASITNHDNALVLLNAYWLENIASIFGFPCLLFAFLGCLWLVNVEAHGEHRGRWQAHNNNDEKHSVISSPATGWFIPSIFYFAWPSQCWPPAQTPARCTCWRYLESARTAFPAPCCRTFRCTCPADKWQKNGTVGGEDPGGGQTWQCVKNNA